MIMFYWIVSSQWTKFLFVVGKQVKKKIIIVNMHIILAPLFSLLLMCLVAIKKSANSISLASKCIPSHLLSFQMEIKWLKKFPCKYCDTNRNDDVQHQKFRICNVFIKNHHIFVLNSNYLLAISLFWLRYLCCAISSFPIRSLNSVRCWQNMITLAYNALVNVIDIVSHRVL